VQMWRRPYWSFAAFVLSSVRSSFVARQSFV
jgi:hypothetical protein